MHHSLTYDINILTATKKYFRFLFDLIFMRCSQIWFGPKMTTVINLKKKVDICIIISQNLQLLK